MLRLLDNSDLLFLRKQPRFEASVARRLRRQRCQIFSRYLVGLEADFWKASLALRVLVSRWGSGRLAIGPVLAGKEEAFRKAVLRARAQLLLYRWGIGGVDASGPIGLFASICNELKDLNPETRFLLAGVLSSAKDS